MLKSKCQTVLISSQGNNYEQKISGHEKCKKNFSQIIFVSYTSSEKLKLFNHSEKNANIQTFIMS